MSLYSLTFLQLKNEAEHAIGGTPDSRTDTGRIVNGAIEWLCARHPWSWREQLTTLGTTNGQGFIYLPTDFGELVDLIGYQLTQTALQKASIRTVMRTRVYGLTGGNLSYVYALGMEAAALATAVPRRTLELGPVPLATTANAFYLTYRRNIAQLVGNTDVPAVPVGFFELLRVAVRAWSKLTTLGDGGGDLAQLNAMLPDYIASDSIAAGPRDGQMSDVTGMLDPDAIVRLAPHTGIEMPGD